MWWIASGVIASVAAIGVLLMVRVDACPAPMSLLEYFRAYGFYVISSPLRATFLGVSTLVFDDGVQAIMTDGFFSRPTLGFPVSITAVTPNDARIDAVGRHVSETRSGVLRDWRLICPGSTDAATVEC